MEQTRTSARGGPAVALRHAVAEFAGRRATGEWAAAILLAAAAGVVLILTSGFPESNGTGPGPGLFPTLVGTGLVCLAVIRMAQLALSLRPQKGHRSTQVDPTPADTAVGQTPPLAGVDRAGPVDRTSVVRFVALSLAQIGYASLLLVLGFAIATTCLAFALLVILGRRPVRALVEAVVAVTLLYLAFAPGLGVVLPTSSLPWLASLGL